MKFFSKGLVWTCFLFLVGSSLLANDAALSTQQIQKIIGHSPFVVVCPPKCGTHLIGKALEYILGKKPTYRLSDLGTTLQAIHTAEDELINGHFLVAHNYNQQTMNELSKSGFKVVFIIRDPRDQLISVQNWLREGQWPWISASKIKDRKAQLTELITGAKKGWKCFESCFLTYANNVKDLPKNSVYYARFENLVGSQGGGSFEKQVNEIQGLATFLDIPLTVEQAGAIANQLFGGTTTFRFGQIGVWKKHFTSKQKTAFKSQYGKYLIKLGYEKDKRW